MPRHATFAASNNARLDVRLHICAHWSGVVQRTVQRLRAEFSEMPGLRLTVRQAQRFCGIDNTICRAALNALVDIAFLQVNADGTYARRGDGLRAHPHAAQPDLLPQRSYRAS